MNASRHAEYSSVSLERNSCSSFLNWWLCPVSLCIRWVNTCHSPLTSCYTVTSCKQKLSLPCSSSVHPGLDLCLLLSTRLLHSAVQTLAYLQVCCWCSALWIIRIVKNHCNTGSLHARTLTEFPQILLLRVVNDEFEAEDIVHHGLDTAHAL